MTHTKPLSQTIVKDKTHDARSGQATPFSARLESTTKMNCHITHLLRRVKTAPGREPTFQLRAVHDASKTFVFRAPDALQVSGRFQSLVLSF